MGLTCITPFVNVVDQHDGEVLLRTNNISSILKYIVKSVKNEKFLVNSPCQVMETFTSLFDFENVTVLKNSKFTSLNFDKSLEHRIVCFSKVSFTCTQTLSQKTFEVYSSKKFVKFNSAIFYETDKKPFDMYMKDGHYHLIKNSNVCRKVQFKIYP